MPKRDERLSAESLPARAESDALRSPEDAGARLRYGWALYGSGDAKGASVQAGLAAGLAPSDAEAPYLMGMALKVTGDPGGAVAAFRSAASMAAGQGDSSRAAMLRRLAIGHANWLEKGAWDLEPETWVRT
jgi:Flp pilus assembly protein TadD